MANDTNKWFGERQCSDDAFGIAMQIKLCWKQLMYSMTMPNLTPFEFLGWTSCTETSQPNVNIICTRIHRCIPTRLIFQPSALKSLKTKHYNDRQMEAERLPVWNSLNVRIESNPIGWQQVLSTGHQHALECCVVLTHPQWCFSWTALMEQQNCTTVCPHLECIYNNLSQIDVVTSMNITRNWAGQLVD